MCQKIVMTTGEQLVEEFVNRGWKSNPFDKLIPIIRNEREQLLALALMIIERVPKGGTFFDLLLSHLTEAEFSIVIKHVVPRLREGSSEVLDSVIAYGSLQFPFLLTPHLRDLFSSRPNSGTYYEEWPWRAADDHEVELLKEAIQLTGDKRAWDCLIQTRKPDALLFASQFLPDSVNRNAGFAAYAHLVGFDMESRPPRKLYFDTAYHIIFPSDYFDETSNPVWLKHENHPTWSPRCESVSSGQFGGDTVNHCTLCEGPLHRLIQIENADAILNTRLSRIELCTCLSCLGWEAPELFFKHDYTGFGVSLATDQERRRPEFPAAALKPALVSLSPATPRWEFQDWALSNSRENLNRIGGAPSWVQDSQYCKCPSCDRIMNFIGQLDSNLPTSKGDRWLWGSGGICYLFWCDPCAISANLWQCT